MGPLLVIVFGCLAIACSWHRPLKSYAFTAWVIVFVAASMFWPGAFGTWLGFDLKFLIVPLIQIIMFGMGTTLSLADFTRVLAMPWPVVVGLVLQFTVMPFVGFGLATLFGFEPEVAAGVILIGSAPAGVASNVINYLARCNVPLSVTMTAISTLMSPVMTPFMMKLLAGKHIEVEFFKMMMDICNMIIVPVVAGLVANRVLYSLKLSLQRGSVLAGIAGGGTLAALGTGLLPSALLGPLKSGLLVGFAMVGAIALAKLVIQVWLKGAKNWMDRALPVVSMAAICFIIAVITARSSEDLRKVGAALLVAAMLHNLLGYFFGYWGARALRLNLTDARTVAVEVGMQNGGLASGLAMNTLQSAKAALAAAIFGPWMNVSGSILASYWRRRPVTPDGSRANQGAQDQMVSRIEEQR
jgi:BASS family bile acid:Na+ symporter